MTNAGFQKLQTSSANGKLDSTPYKSLVATLRAEFVKGTSRDIAWRRQQLEQVIKMYEENYDAIRVAIQKDHGGSDVRLLGETGPLDAAEFALSNLASWTADEAVATPLLSSVTRLGSSFIKRDPKGVVLIIAPWNYPFELCIGPLVSAIAAGNCVVVKPSEVSVHSSTLIEQLIKKYLDSRCIRVEQGAVPETTALLEQHWDHIFYTGNGAVGKIVMKAAAEHLTPVTLELGGKSPCIIDQTARLPVVLNRVTAYKWMNVGQTCIAPDYLIVHESRKEEVLKGLQAEIEKQYGANPKDSQDLGMVINERHMSRLADMLNNSKGRVVTGGADKADKATRYFPPTIFLPDSLDEPVMREEIFGPILPVITYENEAELIPIVQRVCDKPLSFYVYSENKSLQKTLLGASQSGTACINTCLEQFLNIHLPFGGTGGSGMGYSHGKYGFEEFTHKRAVFQQDSLLKRDAMLPPYPHPKWLYNVLVKVKITGFIPRAQRPVVKNAVRVGLLCAIVWAVRKFTSVIP